jgi:hypothetical protein
MYDQKSRNIILGGRNVDKRKKKRSINEHRFV